MKPVAAWQRTVARAWPHRVPLTPSPLRFDANQAIVVPTLQSLQALQPALVRSLASDLHVEDLSARLCPVLCADQRVVLLALAEQVGSDQADELIRRIGAAGMQVAQPARYIVTASVLLSIARGQAFLPHKRSAVADGVDRSELGRVFQELVQWGVRHGASDLHVNIDTYAAISEVRFSIAGRYVAPEGFQGIPTANLLEMLAVAWMDIRGGNGAVFDPAVEQQGAMTQWIDGQPVLLRWASMAAEKGPSVCLRLLERNRVNKSVSLRDLGYAAGHVRLIEDAMRSEGGAMIFAGTVGSGKSTTLAALLSTLPSHRKIMTLEDPVEVFIPGAVQSTLVRDASERDGHGFATKLMALKRSAMTDVLLGEVRDAETGRAFMDLTGSGVSVYTTTHAPSALLAADRLASDAIGVSRDFLATPGLVKLLVYQALLPRLCGHCSLPASELRQRPNETSRLDEKGFDNWLDRLELLCRQDLSGLRFRNTSGCSHCNGVGIEGLRGYDGRTVAAECVAPRLLTNGLSHWRTHGATQPWVPLHVLDRELPPTALHDAVCKALCGEVDARDIEWRFHSFLLQQKLQERADAGGGQA